MTPKQEERLRIKISNIRRELAADKKRWGGFYDDSRGLRYLPPELFIKLRDYKGGLRYLRWFKRTFSDDMGYSIFFFEWALILFKTGNFGEAENKVLEIFFSNYFLLDKFLGKEQKIYLDNEYSSREADMLNYSNKEPEYADFAEWLELFQSSAKFKEFAKKLLDIDEKIENKPVGERRSELVDKRYQLISDL